MTPPRYAYWGLRLTANEAWPALAPFLSSETGVADVHINTQSQAPPPSLTEVSVVADQVQFQIAGVGRYTVCAGRDIEVIPAPGVPRATLELYLFGTAWGALCYQRGLLPLHASVVEVDGAAYAFCGPSGAGKSTLIAALVQRGARLMSDDLCRCDPAGDRAPLVWPSLPRLKLWRETLAALKLSSSGLSQDLAAEDKFLVPLREDSLPPPLPLRALYLLEWGPLGLERLNGTRGLRRLVPAVTYRAAILEQMGRLESYWRQCAQLVRQVQVFRLSRPKEWDCLAASLDLLDWA